MKRLAVSTAMGLVTVSLLVLACSPPALAVTLSVDVGLAGTGNDVQFGWEDFSQTGGSTGSKTITSGLGNGNSLTVELANIDGWRDRGDVLHPIGDVLEDAVFTNDKTMPLTLKNLKAGTYYFRSYHHNTPSDHGAIDVRLTDVTRANRLMVDKLAQTYGPSGGNAGPAATVPLIIQANGTDDVVIGIVDQGFVGYLNGFEITDSPPAGLNVDFSLGPAGRAGNDVQAGFQSFVMENSGSYIPGPQEHWFFTELANAGSARVNVAAPGGELGFRDRGDVAHALGDLAEDFVFNNVTDRLDLTVGSLKPGFYTLTAYLHDRNNAFPGTVDVRVSDALVGEQLQQSDVDVTVGASPATIAAATVRFYSNGIDPVVVHFDEGTAGIVPLAGFESAAAAPSLRVDFARSTGDEQGLTHDVQNGFLPFTSSSPETGDGLSQTFSGELGLGETVTVRLEGNSDALRWRDRGDVVNAELGDMSEDLVFNNEWLEMVLEGLPVSYYVITTYHADPGYDHGSIDIEVDDALGTGRSIVTDLVMPSTRAGDAATATFEFLAGGPVTIRFTEHDSASLVMFNGFALTALVPEPSTFVLAVLGLCGLGLVALRRKRR